MAKESLSEEEPLERSLKKTMAPPAVGCETARARKRLEMGKEGRRGEIGEMCVVGGEKRGWGGGRYFGGMPKISKGGGKLCARCRWTPFTLNDCVHHKRFFYFTCMG